VINTIYGGAREVWRSATEHSFVFDDPRDERRVQVFDDHTDRLVMRIPTRESNDSVVNRLNQASRYFPPPAVWVVLGFAAVALRRPRPALVAVAPAVAGLAVIVVTALVAFPVPEYALPVSPAFILLAVAGLLGAEPRRALRLDRRQPPP
jgi:hypothetical protein